MNTQQQNLLDGLNDFLRSGELTDVILMADDAEFPCHRNVLAASSPYFRAMFTADVKEKTQKLIPIHGISKKALELAVKFIYTGRVDITNDNVQILMTASNLFQMDTLLDACCVHMTKEVCMENCFDVYHFADIQCLLHLKEEAKLFILNNFVEFFEDEQNLKNVDKTMFVDLISSDEVDVAKEETIYEILLRWINVDVENRVPSFPILFKHIRLGLITKEILATVVETNPLIRNNPFCRSMVSVAKIYHLAKLSDPDSDANSSFDINTTCRHGMFKKKMLIFSGGGNSQDQRSFCCFDPKTKTSYFGIKPHSRFKVNHYRLAVTKDCNIFFLGGLLHETDTSIYPALSSVYRYLPKLRIWERCQSMYSARSSFAIAVTENRIYVFGGLKNNRDVKPIHVVETYDTKTGLWHSLSSMPIGISNQAACVYKEDIFLFGGIDEDQYLNTVLQYSIHTDVWSLVHTEMLNPRSKCSAVLYKDKIFVIGGSSRHQNILSVDIYDPLKNKWEFGKDFPEERTVLAVTLFDDVMYVCGGRLVLPTISRSGSSRTIEAKDLYEYDPQRNEWTKIVNLIPFASFQTCTAVVDTRFLEGVDCDDCKHIIAH